MVSEKDVRTVKYFASQDGEDLYRCEENGCVFIRQECDDKYVRWLTGSHWRGGYEADCPLREGLVIHAVDKAGGLLFREYIIKADGYMDTVAEKEGPFSGEAIYALAADIEKRFGLSSYDEWKAWLMNEAEATGFSGYYENWLYDADYKEPVKIAKMDFLGVTVFAVKQEMKHRKCGKAWTDYEIRTVDMSTCVSICGYEFDKEEK